MLEGHWVALIRWASQVLALRWGSASIQCACPACPACPGSPAHNISCICHGAPQPGSDFSGIALAFVVGVAVGLGAAGILAAVGWLGSCRRQRARAQPAAFEDSDERERVQLELRRLRK